MDPIREIENEVAKIVDRNGCPVDVEIFDAVVALRLAGIHTIMSCGGHLDRVTGGPYVMFQSPEAEVLTKKYMAIGQRSDPVYKELRASAIVHNLRERQALLAQLELFYARRQVAYTTRLIVTSFNAEASRLECQGSTLAHIRDGPDRVELLHSHQAEMRAFATFIRASLSTAAASRGREDRL